MDKKECLQLLKKFEGSGFIKYCGIALEDADCGWVRTSMQVKEEVINPFGYVHGGALNTLIDTTGGIVFFVEVKVYSDENEILSKASATFYITGNYSKIPPKW